MAKGGGHGGHGGHGAHGGTGEHAVKAIRMSRKRTRLRANLIASRLPQRVYTNTPGQGPRSTYNTNRKRK